MPTHSLSLLIAQAARETAHQPGLLDPFKDFINRLCAPYYFVPLMAVLLMVALVAYRRWTKPTVALTILAIFIAFYGGSMFDEAFFKIIKKPDNVPITMMIFFTGFCAWLGF